MCAKSTGVWNDKQDLGRIFWKPGDCPKVVRDYELLNQVHVLGTAQTEWARTCGPFLFLILFHRTFARRSVHSRLDLESHVRWASCLTSPSTKLDQITVRHSAICFEGFKMFQVRKLWSLLASLLAFLAATLTAQRITGDVAGGVTDSSGAVIPNVNVTAVNTETGLFRLTTSSTGASILNCRLTLQGYGHCDRFHQHANRQMSAGAVIQANFKLAVGQTSRRSKSRVRAARGTLVEQQQLRRPRKIENVPLNGRDFNSLLAITPGVQRTPGGGFQAVLINGSKVESNNYFIDGPTTTIATMATRRSVRPVSSEYPPFCSRPKPSS
jgi:hypothetical protein